MSAEAVRIVEQIQAVLEVDVVVALDDDETDRRIRQTLAELAQPDFEVAMVGPGYLPEPLERIGAEGFRDGMLTRVEFHLDQDAALHAAGIGS